MADIARDYQDRRFGPGHKYQDLSCSSQRIHPYDAFDSCVQGTLITSNVVAKAIVGSLHKRLEGVGFPLTHVYRGVGAVLPLYFQRSV